MNVLLNQYVQYVYKINKEECSLRVEMNVQSEMNVHVKKWVSIDI